MSYLEIFVQPQRGFMFIEHFSEFIKILFLIILRARRARRMLGRISGRSLFCLNRLVFLLYPPRDYSCLSDAILSNGKDNIIEL